MTRGGRESGTAGPGNNGTEDSKPLSRSEPGAAAHALTAPTQTHYPYRNHCIWCQDERIRALEAEVKTLKDEKRALIEALEGLPKLAAIRQSIESELLSEARGGEEIDAK